MINHVKKAAIASAIALVLALPAYAQMPKSEQMQRTAFETDIRKNNTNEAFFLGPGLGFIAGLPLSLVVSIQPITITIAAGSTSNTQTISSVATASSVIFFGGIRGQNTTINASTDFAALVLTNSTTVTASRNTSDASNSLTVTGSVVYFSSSAIQSVQAGSATMTASSSQTATITAVTTTNAVVIFNGSTTTHTGSAPSAMFASCVLTNSTTVTVQRRAGSNNLTLYFTVLEFKSSVLNSSTQSGTVAMNNIATNTATITSVTTSQTMLVWGGFTNNHGGGIEFGQSPWLTLTNSTTVTGTRAATGGTNDVTVYFSVIEFKSTDVSSVNRGSIVIATSNTTNTATITAASKTLPNYLGHTNSNTATVGIEKQTATLAYTNSTTLTAQRVTGDASGTETVGYEAIGFV